MLGGESLPLSIFWGNNLVRHIELEIHQLLKNMGDPALVADELLKKWARDELTNDDADHVGHFLISFGFANSFLENLTSRLKDGKVVPWSPLFRALGGLKALPQEVADSLLLGCAEQEQLRAMAQYPGISSLDSRFLKVAEEFWSSHEAQVHTEIKRLKDRAQFFKDEELLEEERRVLQELAKLVPQDLEVKARLQDIAALEARLKLQSSQELFDRNEYLRSLAEHLPEADAKMIADFTKRLLKKSKKGELLESDLAIGVFWMGDPQKALDIVERCPPSASRDWLKLEFLLESHRYLDALSWLDHLESQFSHHSETLPACVYARARALWGLKQNDSAISLLESLMKTYPDYRSAHALWMEWTGGRS